MTPEMSKTSRLLQSMATEFPYELDVIANIYSQSGCDETTTRNILSKRSHPSFVITTEAPKKKSIFKFKSLEGKKMRNKERIAILNDCVGELTDSVKKLKQEMQELRQLSCKHDGEVEFVSGFCGLYRRCNNCKKILEDYEDYDLFVIAEAKYIKDMADKAKKEADENYKKVKDEQ